MTSPSGLMGMRIDEELQGPAPEGPLELGDLVGTWVNTDQHVTGRVMRMEASERDGRLVVRGFGVGDTEPRDWGEAEAVALTRTPGDRRAWGFWCRFDLGTITTDVAAYFNSGIVVAGSFNAFGPTSGRTDYWKREFFHREDPLVGSSEQNGAGADFSYAHDRFEGGRPLRPPVDLAPLLGTWVGFTDDLTGVTSLELDGEPGEVRVHVHGSGPAEPPDWGEAEAAVFTDDVGRQEAFAFRARYDHGYEDVEIFGYLNRRVLIAELATNFSDGSGRSRYFTRNFYYPR
jgi:hypothetical protein